MTALISLVAAIVAFRFLPHPGNVAPIGAFALAGGFHLAKRPALVAPFAAFVALMQLAAVTSQHARAAVAESNQVPNT